ncbi:MAG: hypothetical protein LBR21_01410 [Propionibacteriaceae bacterium]|jgi:hypothetical protein|nr:hypothetical protein [Propionibacteriaceae bacterium]
MSALSAGGNLFRLQFPQSVGLFATYEEAQKVVDFLAEKNFPVENLAIVGTDLKSVERVVGKRNWGTVLLSGLSQGVMTGLMVALLMWVVFPTMNFLVILLYAMVIGIVLGLVFAAISQLVGKKRDFNSVSQIVAARYEVLCEHKFVAQAKDLIAQIPGIHQAEYVQPRPPSYIMPGQPNPNAGVGGAQPVFLPPTIPNVQPVQPPTSAGTPAPAPGTVPGSTPAPAPVQGIPEGAIPVDPGAGSGYGTPAPGAPGTQSAPQPPQPEQPPMPLGEQPPTDK